MPETGENVAEEFQVTRADQDAFALRSQRRAGTAIASGYFAEEIVAVEAPGGKSGPIVVDKDEHPRPETTLERLAKLKTPVRNLGGGAGVDGDTSAGKNRRQARACHALRRGRAGRFAGAREGRLKEIVR